MPSTPSARVSSSRLTIPNSSHYSPILKALKSSCSEAASKEVHRAISLEEATRRIVEHEVQSVILDNGLLLVYSVGSPWYSAKVILAEEMVLRIGEGGTFNDLCSLLDDLADEYNVACTVVGTALARNDRAVARLYEHNGFHIDGSLCLVKRRDNGIHQA